jgi:hypothetical protein
MTKKYGGYTAAELREFIAASEQTGRPFDYFARADNATSANVIRDLLDALSEPTEATQAGAVPAPSGLTGLSDFLRRYAVYHELGIAGRAPEVVEHVKQLRAWADALGSDLKAAEQAPVADAARAEADVRIPMEIAIDARRMRTLRHLLDEMDDMGNGFPGEVHAAFQDGGVKTCAALDAVATAADLIHGVVPTQQPAHASEAGEAVALSRHSRAMLLNVLWHHQGGSSTVGQPLRAMLGIGQHDYLTDEQVSEAKWIDGLLATRVPQVPTDDARECLLDVVSHHDNIVAGFAAQRLAAEEANDHDTALYWKREISVAHRMREQAERALATTAQQAVTLTNDARDEGGRK